MYDILMFGEAMALFVADEPGLLEEVDNYTRSVSGAEVNVSIGLTRMGYKVAYVTRLGDDTLGNYITSFLKKEGIITDFIEYDTDYRTGIQFKNKVDEGDALAPYFRKESAATKISKDILKKINFDEIKLIHITGIPLALSESFRDLIYETIAIAKEKKILISFDPNIRESLWSSRETMISTILYVAQQSDIFLPGLAEAKTLTKKDELDDVLDVLKNQGIKNVVMKMGPEGALVLEDDKRYLVDGFKIEEVVDTVGAGDGFASGVLSGILDGLSLKEATKRGNAVGAIQVTHWSDNMALPNRDELKEFMDKY